MYGRIPGEGQFVTAMTTIAPNAKGGKVLHPDVSFSHSSLSCSNEITAKKDPDYQGVCSGTRLPRHIPVFISQQEVQ